MNRYKGEFDIKKLKGRKSEAAKQAFHDIIEDKDMYTIIEVNGYLYKSKQILTEDILTENDTEQ